MAVTVVEAVPVLVTVMDFEGETRPTYVLANARELGDAVICADAATSSGPPRSKQVAK
jgi:hypothetical protein